MTLVFAHHNTLQHLGSNDLHCTIFSSPVKLELSQSISNWEYTITFNYTAHQYMLSKLQTVQHVTIKHIVHVRYECTWEKPNDFLFSFWFFLFVFNFLETVQPQFDRNRIKEEWSKKCKDTSCPGSYNLTRYLGVTLEKLKCLTICQD